MAADHADRANAEADRYQRIVLKLPPKLYLQFVPLETISTCAYSFIPTTLVETRIHPEEHGNEYDGMMLEPHWAAYSSCFAENFVQTPP